ncbi:MAG: metal-dependent transcriptional regulator [Aigarchaeota archaeon]|nr:metal-dependent transcriptional regulator [Aigarchaeota archaeon]
MLAQGEVSAVIEEYLEAIYRLQRKHGVANTGDLVKQLDVAPGTVTNTIERLEKERLVRHVPYRGVKLTAKGRRLALKVLRRHRLAERLLTQLLGINWHKAHAYACRLEHSLPDEVLNRIEEILDHPKTCPHGSPIPSGTGRVREETAKSLLEASVGESVSVVKIEEESEDRLRYFEGFGIIPGVVLKIEEKAPFDGPITVNINGVARAVGRSLASAIHVKPLKHALSKR